MLFTVGPVFVTSLHAQTEESSVTVMSYNIHRGGTMLGQPLSQTVKVIQEAKADVVGVQETQSPSGVNAKKLAQLLGWNYYKDHWSCIMTRFEIVDRRDGGIKIKLTSGQEAYVFSLHLPSGPYQPYQLLSIRPTWHKNWNNPLHQNRSRGDCRRKKGARWRNLKPSQADPFPSRQRGSCFCGRRFQRTITLRLDRKSCQVRSPSSQGGIPDFPGDGQSRL